MATTPPHPGAGPLLIANLLGRITLGLLAMTICLPSMPQWGAIFGESQASAQLTFSAFVVAFGGRQLVHGPLSDRHGRRPILLIRPALAGSLLAAQRMLRRRRSASRRPSLIWPGSA